MKRLTMMGLALISHAVSAADVTSEASDSDQVIILAVQIAVVVAVAFAIGAWIYIMKKYF